MTMNGNYLVRDAVGEKYLLKVNKEKGFEELKLQCEALEAMKKHNVLAPRCIAMNSSFSSSLASPFVFEWKNMDNRVFVTLYTFLEGFSGSLETANVERVTETAKCLAKLNSTNKEGPKLTESSELPRFSLGYDTIMDFINQQQSCPTSKVSKHPFVEYMGNTLRDIRSYIQDPQLRKGMLHCDVFWDNVIFDDSDHVVGLIDFEEVCYGELLLDVAITIHGCCYNSDNSLNEDYVKTFLTTYNEEYPFTPLERSTLKYFMIYSGICLAFWRFRQFNVIIPGHESSNSYKELWDRCEILTQEPFDFFQYS
mmetsp:Transcript_14366/g.18235  ORF Transcript_14366/g.18235 Transcript_14366/m.18235 type:complete len:310 (+) Transcript_14366:1378-2307(+)